MTLYTTHSSPQTTLISNSKNFNLISVQERKDYLVLCVPRVAVLGTTGDGEFSQAEGMVSFFRRNFPPLIIR